MIIRKIFKAEMAHRVKDAYSERCRGVHGHSYIFEIFIKGEKLVDNEMLYDFKRLKDKIGGFLDSFDHSILINEKDVFLTENAEKLNERYIIVPYNPTAEQMAVHIYWQILDLIKGEEIALEKVIVHETKTGFAEYTGREKPDFDYKKAYFSKGAEWRTK